MDVQANTMFRLITSTDRVGKWHRAAQRFSFSPKWRCRCGVQARAPKFGSLEVREPMSWPDMADCCKAIRRGLVGVNDEWRGAA